MAQPGTPGAASIFGGALNATPLTSNNNNNNVQQFMALAPSPDHQNLTPASVASSSNNTYIMPKSPMKNQSVVDRYRPKVTRTVGQKPACLVNASVTYCGNNQIYAFGGFDQYTDEVYNHVLRLDLVSHQWSLVDNYGDIPGVRMGHTATLYKGDKLLVFGGENEHRTYLSDLIIFDLKTAHWTQPQVTGPIPKGRARHAAVLHEDKLFIVGGITGHDNYVLEDICYLDLKTFTWSRAWRFVGRFDHSAYIWEDRVWVFGGLSDEMDKVSDIWWLDLKGSPAFESPPQVGSLERPGIRGGLSSQRQSSYHAAPSPVVGASGYAANSRTAQVNPPSFHLKFSVQQAPGAISALKFVGGPNIPNQMSGAHFHVYSSGMLLDFVTPTPTSASKECSLFALDLSTLRWQKLAEGRDIFKSGYRWHYCTMNDDGTKAWLLGCPTEPAATDLTANGMEEYLSDIMEIDLRRYGFLGNHMASEPQANLVQQSRMRRIEQPSKGLGADLAKLFNQPPETGSGADFVITGISGDYNDEDVLGSALVHAHGDGDTWLPPDTPTSPPIHVHRLILQARWPHFARLWQAQMAEFHTKKMHIPEPYTVVKAFLYYLYTDRIDSSFPSSGDEEPLHVAADLSDVAGLLVMSNIYNIPHLRLLCVNRLSKDLDVDHACTIWYCAGLASEEWLRKRAASYCLTHWGRIVRTSGFQRLSRTAMIELSQEIDTEGRVVGGEELDMLSMDGDRFGGPGGGGRKESVSSHGGQDQQLDEDEGDEDGMEMT